MRKLIKILVGITMFVIGISGALLIGLNRFSDDIGTNFLIRAGLYVLLAGFLVFLSFFLEPPCELKDYSEDSYGHSDL